MSYAVRSAFLALWREKWINLLSVITIGAALLLILIAGFFAYNLERAARNLPDRFTVMVFFKNGLSDSEARQGAERIKNIGIVSDVRYISADKALKELRGAMKDSDFILEGLESNPLPASAEVRLKKGSVNEEGVRELSKHLATIDQVDDVQYGDKLLGVIHMIQRYAETFGGALVLALSIGVIFVCYSTVKILFYRKREEINTMKFLGATKWFIRTPFIIEGSILGLGGGAFSAGAALSLYYVIFTQIAQALPVLHGVQLPTGLMLLSLPAGLLVGTAGALIAVGRIRF
jgi:cell division transport system permease protein